jgi:hypothetical protein
MYRVRVSVCLREFSPTTINHCLPIKRLVLVTGTQCVVCDVGELRACHGEVRSAEAAVVLHKDRDMTGDSQNIGRPDRTGPNQHTRFVCPVFSVINSHFINILCDGDVMCFLGGMELLQGLP